MCGRQSVLHSCKRTIVEWLQFSANPGGPRLARLSARRFAVKNVQVAAGRVLSEFEEMPGMMLTVHQASKLFGLDQELCRVVLDVLIDGAYLRQTPSGRITLGERVAA